MVAACGGSNSKVIGTNQPRPIPPVLTSVESQVAITELVVRDILGPRISTSLRSVCLALEAETLYPSVHEKFEREPFEIKPEKGCSKNETGITEDVETGKPAVLIYVSQIRSSSKSKATVSVEYVYGPLGAGKYEYSFVLLDSNWKIQERKPRWIS